MPTKAFRETKRDHVATDVTNHGSDMWTWVVLNVLKVPTDVAYSYSQVNVNHNKKNPALPQTAAATWKKKMAVRIGAGLVMAALLSMIVAAGHLAVCIMVIAIQFAIFGELVDLRFHAAKTKATEGPFFRTLQWGWFATAMAHSYGSSWLKAPLGAQKYLAQLHRGVLVDGTASGTSPEAVVEAVAVALYSVMLVATVLSLTPGLYAQQIGQLSWTGFVLLAVVFQLKATVYSIYSGLYFLLFPASLVAVNDTAAYFCGMCMGNKIIQRPFMALSPSKTWEGFLGALVLTVWYAYSTANVWGSSAFLRCSYPELTVAAPSGICAADRYFVVGSGSSSSGGINQISRAQMVGVGLALFAGLIAPFGGFFASAVKRATSVKDFAGWIPGHGGLTDRMDCQLVMAVAARAVFSVCMPLAASQVGNFKYDAVARVFVNGSA